MAKNKKLTPSRKITRNRPVTKGPGILLKLKAGQNQYLRRAAQREGRPMTVIVEECLELREKGLYPAKGTGKEISKAA